MVVSKVVDSPRLAREIIVQLTSSCQGCFLRNRSYGQHMHNSSVRVLPLLLIIAFLIILCHQLTLNQELLLVTLSMVLLPKYPLVATNPRSVMH
jgi:hypothetical protein